MRLGLFSCLLFTFLRLYSGGNYHVMHIMSSEVFLLAECRERA